MQMVVEGSRGPKTRGALRVNIIRCYEWGVGEAYLRQRPSPVWGR
ncbi:hypothetical protein E2C01_090301 [Portunus trituberculatus]|uniref:Uncharacterized protein n=1 Tax=Portunus trituberculatus TaxID=210409 RepID=A0A5B7JKI4_PORTR|nr:hypothetical protein [Portunus trituberculatus]